MIQRRKYFYFPALSRAHQFCSLLGNLAFQHFGKLSFLALGLKNSHFLVLKSSFLETTFSKRGQCTIYYKVQQKSDIIIYSPAFWWVLPGVCSCHSSCDRDRRRYINNDPFRPSAKEALKWRHSSHILCLHQNNHPLTDLKK